MTATSARGRYFVISLTKARVVGAEQVVDPPQLSGSRRRPSAPRFAHELHVIHVGAGVGPVVGARQRGRAFARVEGARVGGFARFECIGDASQQGFDFGPAVERGLQRGGDGGDGHEAREGAVDDDELAVAARGFAAGEFHRGASAVAPGRQLST
jgi:hypothetical protein